MNEFCCLFLDEENNATTELQEDEKVDDHRRRRFSFLHSSANRLHSFCLLLPAVLITLAFYLK